MIKTTKTYLDAFQHEAKEDRTNRVSKSLVEEAAEERREKSRLQREARIERDNDHGKPTTRRPV